MNLYVETNFILELAFMQEQHESCDKILTTCEAGRSHLILPAFCIAESYSALIHQSKRRSQLATELAKELHQLARTTLYQNEMDAFDNTISILGRSSQDEEQRLSHILSRLLRVAEIISLEAEIIVAAFQNRTQYKLAAQDSIIFSAILKHLSSAGGIEGCFINKNRQDFNNPDIGRILTTMSCKMLFNFDSGLHYIQKS